MCRQWPSKLIGQLFDQPELDIQTSTFCCKTWDRMDVAQVLKHVSHNICSRIVSELYDEEEVWDDDAVSEVLEQLEVRVQAAIVVVFGVSYPGCPAMCTHATPFWFSRTDIASGMTVLLFPYC